ncbi:MAG: hypothetical protein WD060_09130 [Pirellulales bacterium]
MAAIPLDRLAASLEGEVSTAGLARTIYSTDASEYQERPLAVACPKSAADVGTIVRFAAGSSSISAGI